MNWQLNLLSDIWEKWITSELTVEEWCGDSVKARSFDLENIVSVKINKIKLTISKCTSVKSVEWN